MVFADEAREAAPLTAERIFFRDAPLASRHTPVPPGRPNIDFAMPATAALIRAAAAATRKVADAERREAAADDRRRARNDALDAAARAAVSALEAEEASAVPDWAARAFRDRVVDPRCR